MAGTTTRHPNHPADAADSTAVTTDALDAAAETAADHATVKLAHHLDVGEDGLPAAVDNPAVKSYKPGDSYSAPRPVISALIHAGYVQVNPHNAADVEKLLAPSKKK